MQSFKSLLMRKSRKKGSILVMVMIVSTVLWISIIYSMSAMTTARKLTLQNVEHERALMLAQSGLAQGLEWLNVQGTQPSSNTTLTTLNNPNSTNYDLDVKVFPDTIDANAVWTISSTATYKAGTASAERGFSRRVQATVYQMNFARYEQFTDQTDVWTSGYLHFFGFNAVYFGPFHVNSGMGLWPNLWFCEESTGSAPDGIFYYPNYNSYLSAVYNKNSSKTRINIMQYYNSTYKFEPKFYKGLQRINNIAIPQDLGVDQRASALRANAGLKLPDSLASYLDPVTNQPFYDATKGKKFVIVAEDPSNAQNDGRLKIRQYRGKLSNVPQYGPEVVKTISEINGALIVTGDIESLKGVIDGKLTIGAFKTSASSGDGNIKIDGSIEYESRKANADFKYSDAPELYTSDGADVNLAYVDTLKNQVYALNDILGIVAEKEVIVPRYDLNNAAVGTSMSNSMRMDCIVMATGSSTSSTTDGAFYPEDMLNRPTGLCHKLGGVIQNRGKSWALFSGGNFVAGLDGPSLWDFRAVLPGGAPPFFPTTGVYTYLKNSWRDTYVADATEDPVLPN
ncbi:hypothetical protein IT570_13660 [Candidatus Sumerlaeota bacterium]|nr:hypothetical protein [Candidatus Sumerlaeota bacterium]